MIRRRAIVRRLIAGALALFVLAEAATRVTFAVRKDAPPHLDPSVQLEWEWAAPILERGRYVDAGGSVFDPRLGYRMAPNRDEEGVRTNSAGLRADREFRREPTPGIQRILLVGDSYTWGFGVANEETWAARLEERLPHSEVLNLGVPGYGTDQAILAYEEFGADYAPHVVVLGIFVRDFFRNAVTFRGYAKPRFELGGEDRLRLIEDHILPPQQLAAAYLSGERRMGGWHYSYLWSLVGSKLAGSPLVRGRLDEQSALVRLMGALLRRFRTQAEQRGASPFLLILPERLDKHRGTHWETIEQLTLQQAAALGLPALSVTPRFVTEEARRPNVPLNPDHLSVRGNEIVAEELARALRAAGLVPD